MLAVMTDFVDGIPVFVGPGNGRLSMNSRVGFCHCTSGLLTWCDPTSVCGNGDTALTDHV